MQPAPHKVELGYHHFALIPRRTCIIWHMVNETIMNTQKALP